MSKKKILAFILLSSIFLNYQVQAEAIELPTLDVEIASAVDDASTLVDNNIVNVEQSTSETIESTVVTDESDVNATTTIEEPTIVENVDETLVSSTEMATKASTTSEISETDNTNVVVTEPTVVTSQSQSVSEKVTTYGSESNQSGENTVVVTSQTSYVPVSSVENNVQVVGADLNQKPVGTLIRLGVSDGTKPVGKLSYYRQTLPNTNFKNNKVGIVAGVVMLTGLLVSGLYYFAKRAFD